MRWTWARDGGETGMSDEMIVSFDGGKKVRASYGDFEIMTDQSVKNGGGASAPEPYDLFLASLANCAGVYVLGFCDKRGIPTDGIQLVESWQRDSKGRIETIRIDIEVPDDFPEKYRDALVRVANQCAVKKTLENPPEFQVETKIRDVQEA
jgi:ribosomal protein S12 methylthiotransferase accessory factor